MANELFPLPHVAAILQEMAEDIRTNYIDQLRAHKHPTTENTLVNSVRTQVEVDGSFYEVTMTLRDYWKYVEEDTRPHWPPKEPIDHWIEVKPIVPRPGRNGRVPSPASLSYLIRRKIATVGTKGTHDLAQTKDAVIPLYLDRLADALGHDAVNYIAKVL